MAEHAERRLELQAALAIVQQHPQATDAELDALVKEALQLRTTPMARLWRILAQDQHRKGENA